ncbi:MAG: dockerin type I domain-containing protein [Pirellulales bacterium]
MTPIGAFAGHRDSIAYAINDSGQVVGRSGSPPAFNFHTSRTYTIDWGEVIGFTDFGYTPGSCFRADVDETIDPFERLATRMRTFDEFWNPTIDVAYGTTLGNGIGPGFTSAVNSDGSIRLEITGHSDFDYQGDHFETGQLRLVLGLAPPSNRRAFLWDPASGMRNLGDLPRGEDYSYAWDINNAGQVVGGSVVEGCSAPEDHTKFHAFAWDVSQGMRDLNSIATGAETLIAGRGINDLGQIVGLGQFTPDPFDSSGFHWDPATNDAVHAFDGQAWDINNGGLVVGHGELPHCCSAVTWTSDEGVVTLDASGGAEAVNNLGDVVGWQGGRAIMWRQNGEKVDLGSFPDGAAPTPYGINDHGIVVGGHNPFGPNPRPFIWDETDGLRNLNDLIDPASGWTLTRAQGINNSGQIVGQGIGPNGYPEAFVLTPLESPTSPSDLNGDGNIDRLDMAILAFYFGTPELALPNEGDINRDGRIDLTDLAVLQSHLGESDPAAIRNAAVPEISALSMLVAGALTVLLFSRRSFAGVFAPFLRNV